MVSAMIEVLTSFYGVQRRGSKFSQSRQLRKNSEEALMFVFKNVTRKWFSFLHFCQLFSFPPLEDTV